MVLAAGRGRRLKPLSDTLPKPLLKIAGRTLLDRTLDRLVEAGIKDVVVNLHYLGEKIREHLNKRNEVKITYSEEVELLETGGSLLNALSYFEDEPFFVVNGDVLWQDDGGPALSRLVRAWDDTIMDGLLLVQPIARAIGYDGKGDFEMDKTGHLERKQADIAAFVFTGIQLLHPRLFAKSPKGRFSLNLLYDQALSAGRLFGLTHEGPWYHIGTMDGLALAETRFQEKPV